MLELAVLVGLSSSEKMKTEIVCVQQGASTRPLRMEPLSEFVRNAVVSTSIFLIAVDSQLV